MKNIFFNYIKNNSKKCWGSSLGVGERENGEKENNRENSSKRQLFNKSDIGLMGTWERTD